MSSISDTSAKGALTRGLSCRVQMRRQASIGNRSRSPSIATAGPALVTEVFTALPSRLIRSQWRVQHRELISDYDQVRGAMRRYSLASMQTATCNGWRRRSPGVGARKSARRLRTVGVWSRRPKNCQFGGLAGVRPIRPSARRPFRTETGVAICGRDPWVRRYSERAVALCEPSKTTR